MMMTWQRVATYALMGLVGLGLVGCGPKKPQNLQKSQNPRISFPDSVNFNQLNVGESQTSTVIIENTGDAPLEIESVELIEEGEDGEQEFTRGDKWSERATIEPGGQDFLELDVEYAPVNAKSDTGEIVIASNDPDYQRRDAVIELSPKGLNPRLKVDQTVNFSSTPPGASASKIVTVQNVGQATLEVDEITISGNSTFQVTVPKEDEGSSMGGGGGMKGEGMQGEGSQAPEPADDRSVDAFLDGGKEVAPGGGFKLRIWFQPEDASPKEATMTIFSNDADSEKTKVKLSGNSKSACLGLSHEEEVGFGQSSTGSVATRTVTLENCRPRNAKDLEIESIEVIDDGGGVFGLKEESLPGELNGKKHVIVGESRSNFTVTFTPPEKKKYTGKLRIESNDPSRRKHIVELIGEGSDNACPTALAEAKIEGSSRTKTTINTLPLEKIVFDGSKSSDPDGSIDRYEWSIIERPEDSTARLTPNANAPKPKLFLDLAGTYKIELVVYDDKGAASCGDQAIVTLKAVPQEDIHVQLVWDTPGDGDQTDTSGADLDLHYLSPKATEWNKSPYDIFWHNKEADWGQANDPTDDPSLDIDDTDGAGPENVNHNNPEPGLNYTVGVYYYDDHGFGPSYATVRIYINGALKEEYKNKFMSGTFDFWKVALIQWPTGVIYKRDRKFNGFP